MATQREKELLEALEALVSTAPVYQDNQMITRCAYCGGGPWLMGAQLYHTANCPWKNGRKVRDKYRTGAARKTE